MQSINVPYLSRVAASLKIKAQDECSAELPLAPPALMAALMPDTTTFNDEAAGSWLCPNTNCRNINHHRCTQCIKCRGPQPYHSPSLRPSHGALDHTFRYH
eukprot:NODE_4629_length_1038_cov_59.027322_g4426_i0.p2 GENE.NODE_4629_length_1038_cov_59.027322_g4426_i0~~NODE_4629_length_1038_cov_59.027322_g4426_i0.p2  ORF type:complete len:101 (+),score=9.38 NODE_4629_length_1038_cov_59.027322_g4426_i0:404-706(+)